MRVSLLVTTLAFLLLACSPEQTSTPRPASSPSPSPDTPGPSTDTPGPLPVTFGLYGETLTDVTYCTVDGSSQKMDVYFPDSGGLWPALVYVHGGSWMHGDKSEAVMFASKMTAQGYLVVSINYRLYPAGRFPTMIEDVKCAIRSLRAHAGQYNLDPERIAAIGPIFWKHIYPNELIAMQ